MRKKLSLNSPTSTLWFLLINVGLQLAAFGQSKTTVTGSVQSPSGTPATSGYVEFRLNPLNPSTAYRIAGSAIIAPQSSQCSISSTGSVVAYGGVGSCQVWGNNTILPASTCYDIVLAPNGIVSGTIQRQLISGGIYDLSTPT